VCFNHKTKCFESKKITGWVKKEPENPWCSLSYKGCSKKNTGNYRRIIITGDHQVFTNNGYVRVDDVDCNTHKIATKFLEPSENQKEFIDGALLGDSFYQKPNKKREMAPLIIKQSQKQE